VIAAYCFARYGDAVGMFFFLDDFWLLRDADAVYEGPWNPLVEVFRPSHNGFLLYRPLTQLGYFYVLRQLFGVDASPYHAFHLGLFATNAWLVAAIVRTVTASWGWALAGGLLYAAAPGHALAVYWVAAAVMTGTATIMFLLLLWWLRAPARWQAPGAALLQIAALGCSEHAVVTPLLLVWITPLTQRRGTIAERLRPVLPTLAVTVAYLAAKLVYFLRYGFPSGGYALTAAPAEWCLNLGRFALAVGNLPTLRITKPATVLGLGAVLAAALPILIVVAARRGGRWTLPAVGLGLFVTALLPVLPLAQHFYRYFIGVAALGLVLAGVGVGRALPRGGLLAAVLVLAVLAVDRSTCDRAARDDADVQLLVMAERLGRDLVRDLDHTARMAPAGRKIRVPASRLNASVIGFGGADRVFFDPPIPVHYGADPPPPNEPEPLPLSSAGNDGPTPGATPSWDWLRGAAAAAYAVYAGPCR
jgi:hypothetical protein